MTPVFLYNFIIPFQCTNQKYTLKILTMLQNSGANLLKHDNEISYPTIFPNKHTHNDSSYYIGLQGQVFDSSTHSV